MDLERIEQLLQLLAEHDVSSFSYRDEKHTIKLTLGSQVVTAAAMQMPVALAPAAALPGPAPADAPALESGLVEVESPMVGTFYRSPSPDSPPFVEPGSKVTRGQTLCIVEAMKLMNEIEADVSGTLVEVLVDNSQPVQFGQALFTIRPA
jgi:acetyl-CoA carboxylase biotin carboxyl carrier protein